MVRCSRMPARVLASLLVLGTLALCADFSFALLPFPLPQPFIPPAPTLIPPAAPPNPTSVSNPNGGAGGVSGIQRITGFMSNPTNFHQYSQITGVGPIRGTVRIYNQFGSFYGTNGSGGGGGVGSSGGFGSTSSFSTVSPTTGGGGFGTGLPGTGSTYNGDDPPQGVLLHVNYASMFLPNQQGVNQLNNASNGGSFGSFGGKQTGNGGWGL